MKIETFPTQLQLEELAEMQPEYTRPNTVPTAVIIEEALTDLQCDEIISLGEQFHPYQHPGCDAKTRELGVQAPELVYVKGVAEIINRAYFGFDLDEEPFSWMQTYEPGDSYSLHADADPGRMRKLTAVVQLSDESAYENGFLRIRQHSQVIRVPKTRGTIAIFPSWVLHEVTSVSAGKRQTINMGFHGPNFK